MLKAVVDTNLFISGTIIKKGIPFELLKAWRQSRFVLISSNTIIDEIVRVLRYPKVRKARQITEEEIKILVSTIIDTSIMTEGEITLDVVKDDPDDNKILGAAVEGGADYIISGDHHLLNLKEYQGINIVTAKEFLEILKQLSF